MEVLESNLDDLERNDFSDECGEDWDELEENRETCTEAISWFRSEDSKAPTLVDRLEQLPLYPGCQLSYGESMLLVMAFILSHHLSSSTTVDLLELIGLHTQYQSLFCTSKYLFDKFFSLKNLTFPVQRHYFCSACLTSVSEEDAVCNRCNSNLQSPKSTFYFLEMSILSQLQAMFQRKGFYQEIIKQRQRKKKNQSAIEDITDGSIYTSNQQLQDKHNISFLMNTDGIKVFRSSNYGLWPVYLAINELPFRMRTRRENMVFAGLWFGEYKPKMRIFLPPLAKSIKALADGFQVRPPDTTPFECKAFLLACSCDLQAKALVMDMVAHNGYYGCPKCLQKGTHNDRRHQYPCGAEGAQDPLRTHEETLAHAREAHIQQTTVYGIKGPSWLNLAPRFNLISGMTIDYMHGSLLGITKALMSLWFKSAKTQRYYCGHHLQEIDEMMLAMRPPLDIHRTPRAIQDHMQHWKASEYRAWLLFYSLPIMQHFLPPDYYENYTLLVTGLHILLKDTITEAELQSADDHLKQFVNGFEKLYGTSRVSLNVHSLLHYADTVRELGPLWAHSCFFFEDVNGQVLRLIHGTQAVEEQRFAEMGDQCFEPGTPAKKLWDKLNSVVQSPEERSNFEQIARGYYMVGSLKEELRRANGTYGSLKKCHVDVVLANVEFVPERFMVYQRFQ
uniref:Transposase domain-containing protein n=1 Tax=Branchiostoma floridae TaxID=7739 RepID=C3XVM8_BRAFL|eukprot:XP_002611812.1 hypothetical protein BRAFLDRAFT_103034 [Branchiostoma floridae]